MKKKIATLLIIVFSGQLLLAQNTSTFDFESYNSTPYYFRFGNSTSVTYFPRWKYSHEVVDNPLITIANNSSKVLRYSSLEARRYGLKFKFSAPLNLDDIDTLSFDIYQTSNIIGKAVNTTYSANSATNQEIRVKFLTYFNTIQDSREDAGVVLNFTGSVVSFSQTGIWYKYKVHIDRTIFSVADQSILSTGVLGIAIMPTYNSGVTLLSEHVCYIDNLKTILTPISTTVSSSRSIGTSTLLPGTDLTVASGVQLDVDNTSTVHSIILNPGAKLTLFSGKALTVGMLTLQSDASGTATFVDNGGTLTATTVTVKQYLTTGRNWYVSSPVSAATSNVFNAAAALNINKLYTYDETQGGSATLNWPQITDNATSLAVAKGYIANVDATMLAATNGITFSGGGLNTGTITTGLNGVPALTSTLGATYQGYNLVGNPYPSYLNAMTAINNANTENGSTVIDPTIWYRTQANSGTYHFETVNTTSGVGTNNSRTGMVTGYIPPMQAFWVHTTGETALTFDNTMRAHAFNVPVLAGTVPTTLLKSAAVSGQDQKLLRIEVSNGTNRDEAIVYSHLSASNGFDAYDSRKRPNNVPSVPEVYTSVGAEHLVINGLNDIVLGTELPLGFATGQSNVFTIKASQATNFDDGIRIVLKDKLLQSEQDLSDGSAYTFTSDATSTDSRFSVVIKTAGGVTGIHSDKVNTISIYITADNQIMVDCKGEISRDAVVSVYNLTGLNLESKQMTSKTLMGQSYTLGVYVVKVHNGGKIITKKVILY